VRLLLNEPETPTTRRIRLALDGAPFRYRAGQAATLAAGSAESTPYSIASAPHETSREAWLEFLVKVDGSSRFGAIVDTLQPGTRINVEGPVGSFTLPDPSPGAPLLFIAGGTGIAPLRSMILEALHAGNDGGLALVYSARTPDEFAYLHELRALADRGRLALTLTLTGEAQDWGHARGRTGPAHLSNLVSADTMAYICGPPAMVKEVPVALTSIGLPRTQIRTEDW
jgi:sulfhydrogenase subunit gamma (sulfur reductase)